MTNTNVRQLGHAIQQAQEWMNELTSRPPFEVEEQAYSYLRAVLHTLRDRLTVDETVHLAAHLPALIRGVFYEGWRPAEAPHKIKSPQEFYQTVDASFGGTTPARTIDTVAATNAVLAFLEEHVDAGEIRHVKAQLPKALQGLFRAA